LRIFVYIAFLVLSLSACGGPGILVPAQAKKPGLEPDLGPPIDHLIFINEPLIVGAFSDCSPVTIETRDKESRPLAVHKNQDLNLLADGGFFYIDEACSEPKTSITIPKEASQVALYYQATDPGTHTIKALPPVSYSWTPATQDVTATSLLTGTWQSLCTQDLENSEADADVWVYKRTFTFAEDLSFTATIDEYYDEWGLSGDLNSQCQGPIRLQTVIAGTYSEGQMISESYTLKALDLVRTSWTMTILDSGFMAAINSSGKICGKVDWQLQSPVSFMGATCGGTAFPSDMINEFTSIEITKETLRVFSIDMTQGNLVEERYTNQAQEDNALYSKI
jgi:hypothetical protein